MRPFDRSDYPAIIRLNLSTFGMNDPTRPQRSRCLPGRREGAELHEGRRESRQVAVRAEQDDRGHGGRAGRAAAVAYHPERVADRSGERLFQCRPPISSRSPPSWTRSAPFAKSRQAPFASPPGSIPRLAILRRPWLACCRSTRTSGWSCRRLRADRIVVGEVRRRGATRGAGREGHDRGAYRPGRRMAVVGAPSYSRRDPDAGDAQDLVGHNCINLRLPTSGGLLGLGVRGRTAATSRFVSKDSSSFNRKRLHSGCSARGPGPGLPAEAVRRAAGRQWRPGRGAGRMVPAVSRLLPLLPEPAPTDAGFCPADPGDPVSRTGIGTLLSSRPRQSRVFSLADGLCIGRAWPVHERRHRGNCRKPDHRRLTPR